MFPDFDNGDSSGTGTGPASRFHIKIDSCSIERVHEREPMPQRSSKHRQLALKSDALTRLPDITEAIPKKKKSMRVLDIL